MRVTERERERAGEKDRDGAMESKVVLIKIPTEKDTATAAAGAADAARNGAAFPTQNILK